VRGARTTIVHYRQNGVLSVCYSVAVAGAPWSGCDDLKCLSGWPSLVFDSARQLTLVSLKNAAIEGAFQASFRVKYAKQSRESRVP